MKKVLVFLACLFFAVSCYAQTTTVSGTVIDSDSTTWTNGTITVQFIPNPSQPNLSLYNINGVPLSPSVINQGPISLGGSGTFSLSVYQSAAVSPSGSTWQYTICPNASSKCGVFTIQAVGTTQNLTSSITALIPAPRFLAVIGSYGYNNTEAQVSQVPGSLYYNVISSCYEVWSGSSFGCMATGAGIYLPLAGGTLATNAAIAFSGTGAATTLNNLAPGISSSGTGGLAGSGWSLSNVGLGTFNSMEAATTNNICIAANQHTANAGSDILACQASLPSAGGIIDATGYTGTVSLGSSLAFTKTVDLRLGAAIYDATGVILAENLPQGITIHGSGQGNTVILGDTGPGKPVISFVGSSFVTMFNLSVNEGVTNPSSIAWIQARSALYPNTQYSSFHDITYNMTPGSNTANQIFATTMTLTAGSCTIAIAWNNHLLPMEWIAGTGIPANTYIQTISATGITVGNAAGTCPTISGSETVNGYAGTIGILNYGAEVSSYHNIVGNAGKPFIAMNSNGFNIAAPGVAFYTGLTTMESVLITGKSTLACDLVCLYLDGVGNGWFDIGEIDGGNYPGTYAVVSVGYALNDTIIGEMEVFPRALYISQNLSDSNLNFVCAGCQNAAYTGNLTTNGTTTATPASMAGWAIGDEVTNSNVVRGTYVTAINNGTVTLSQAASGSGTSAATVMEPIIGMDSTFSGSGQPTNLSSTTIHIIANSAPAPAPVAETYYIMNFGSYNFQSTGWTAYLPVGTNVVWNSATSIGDIYEPYQTSFSAPLINGGILAKVHLPSGVESVPMINLQTGIAGQGTATFTLGGSSIVGAGATVACVTGHVCDQFSGQFILTTGTTSANGVFLTINFPTSRTNLPNCGLISFFDNAAGTEFYYATISIPTISTLPLYSGTQLTSSHTFIGSYICGGI
jgi:hypothetical protein